MNVSAQVNGKQEVKEEGCTLHSIREDLNFYFRPFTKRP